MASKWAKLKGKFPDAPVADMDAAVDPKYKLKVDAAKLPYQGLSLGDLMKAFSGFKEKKDVLSDEWKAVNLELEALGQLIKDKFEEQDVNSVKTDFGRTVYLNIEPYSYVKKDKKDDFEKRVMEDPQLDYLWSIHHQMLNSWIKDMLEKGNDEQIPPEIEVYLKTQVRIRES